MLNFLGPTPSQHLLASEDVDILKRSFANISIVARGGDICTSPDHIHLVQDGWATKYRVLGGGRRQLVRLHFGGDICDMDRLFHPDLRYGVQALSDCRISTISIRAFRQVAETHPLIRNLFWSLMALENVALVEQVTDLGSRSARERMAHFLYGIAVRLEPRGQMHGRTFRMEFSQGDIAQYLGLSLVHTNRTLRNLADEDIIKVRKRNYTILDVARLKAVAGADDAAMESVAWRGYEASNVLLTSIQGHASPLAAAV